MFTIMVIPQTGQQKGDYIRVLDSPLLVCL